MNTFKYSVRIRKGKTSEESATMEKVGLKMSSKCCEKGKPKSSAAALIMQALKLWPFRLQAKPGVARSLVVAMDSTTFFTHCNELQAVKLSPKFGFRPKTLLALAICVTERRERDFEPSGEDSTTLNSDSCSSVRHLFKPIWRAQQ